MEFGGNAYKNGSKSRSEFRQTWIQTLAQPRAGCVPLGKWVNFLSLTYLLCKMGMIVLLLAHSIVVELEWDSACAVFIMFPNPFLALKLWWWGHENIAEERRGGREMSEAGSTMEWLVAPESNSPSSLLPHLHFLPSKLSYMEVCIDVGKNMWFSSPTDYFIWLAL